MLTILVILCSMAGTYAQQLSPISMPALGRQFTLGVLYDRRREVILEGPKPWNEEELRNYDTVASYGTHFEIVASSDDRESMNHFELSASLKMSFLAGMVDVSGSAGYLQDRKHKNRLARVSLGYKSSTFKRTLAPELFLKVTYPEVLKKIPDATDVVVAIQYGAGAIFVFERELSESEKMRQIEGLLDVEVKKLPSFSVSGSGEVNITEKERKAVEKFSCRFHGDFILKKHPGTYEEAIQVYQQLPGLLGHNYENSVPVKVWLYPIEKLPVDRAVQLVYDINESLTASVTDVITDLEELIRQCSDILSTTVCRRHGRIRDKVFIFKSHIRRYMLQFKQEIVQIFPEVRKGTKPIEELTKLVSKKEFSPFSKIKLEKWLSYYNEEVRVLSKIQSLPNYCRNDGDFSSKLLNEVRFTIGLTLQLGKTDEEYLNVLEHYLGTQVDIKVNAEVSKWFHPGSDILSDLFIFSTTIKDFDERLKGENALASSSVQFLVREKIMQGEDSQGITIEFYDRAVLKERNYQLTSPPGKPTATGKTYENITLVWGKPTKGLSRLQSYKVNVYIVKEDGEPKECKGQLCKITSISTTETTKIITGLQSQRTYVFTVSAYTNLGETSVSVMSDEIVTNKCSPGTYHLTKHECKECDPGTYSDKVGMTSCSVCPAGTYNRDQRATESTQCMKCPAGTYSPKLGSQSLLDCIPCVMGSYGSKEGAGSLDSCQQCQAGTYGDIEGLSSCERCKKDSYNPELGKRSCVPCPDGTHTQSTGATWLSECLGGDEVVMAQRKVRGITDKLQQGINRLKVVRALDERKLSKSMAEFRDQKTKLKKDMDTKVKAVVDEMKVVHESEWKYGEGHSMKQRVTMIDAKTREECIYKCLQYARKHPDLHINGVTRKLSTKSCMCVEGIFKVSTRRYEYCKIIS